MPKIVDHRHIYELWLTGDWTEKDICKEFGISSITLQRILIECSKPKKKSTKDPMWHLTMDAVAAKEMGLSYGEYMGRRYQSRENLVMKIQDACELLREDKKDERNH